MARQKVSLQARLTRDGPRKLLAIDGGGIRGILSLQVLKKIEAILRQASGNADYRLADYFDYISGTSTGGIIAAGLSIGKSVDEILSFYTENGPAIFTHAGLIERLRYHYQSEPLAEQLKSVFGADETLASPQLETLLLLVLRNATTDSPWPISNNPFAKYNDPAHPACNLHFPLWQLVRASSAAPVYFPPEVIVVGEKQFIFVDGGVTTYNDPAFQMVLMATVDRFWPRAPAGKQGWQTGTDKMLVVSVGTGTSPGANDELRPDDMNLIFNATKIPSALMFAALTEQDFLCRTFGDCVAGDPLDREVGTMIGSSGPLAQKDKLFRYVRYNAELTPGGLAQLGCGDLDATSMRRMDSISSIQGLRRIGSAVADRKVREEHLNLAVFRP